MPIMRQSLAAFAQSLARKLHRLESLLSTRSVPIDHYPSSLNATEFRSPPPLVMLRTKTRTEEGEEVEVEAVMVNQ